MKFSLQILLIVILLTAYSCENRRKAVKQYSYFDLEGFFLKEVSRLHDHNPKVLKTVTKNTESETRELQIGDWAEEMSLFSSSDINKPAWKRSYKKSETSEKTVYEAIDVKLRTKRILIQKNKKGKVTHIAITNKVTNSLYSSTERLNYYPDSLYQIHKEQKVRLLGRNVYSITGKLR